MINMYAVEGIKAMSEVYGQSKLANILFAKEFGRRFKDAGIQTFAVHPGAVMTEFGRNFKERMPAFIQPITDYLASLGKLKKQAYSNSIQ